MKHRKEKLKKKNEKSINDVWNIIRVPKEKRKRIRQKLFQRITAKVSKLVENYKLTDPRSS